MDKSKTSKTTKETAYKSRSKRSVDSTECKQGPRIGDAPSPAVKESMNGLNKASVDNQTIIAAVKQHDESGDSEKRGGACNKVAQKGMKSTDTYSSTDGVKDTTRKRRARGTRSTGVADEAKGGHGGAAECSSRDTADKCGRAESSSVADGVTVLTSHPDMPRTLLANARKGYFLCTYVNKWVPAHINEKGQHVPGRSKPAKRVTIGRIHSPDGLGLVEFNEKFYEDYPSLRDYIVTRVGKAQFEFRRLSEHTVSSASNDAVITGALSSGSIVSCSDGSLIRSADGIPMSTDPANLLSILKHHEEEHAAKICAPVVNRSPTEITGYALSFGNVLLMLNAMSESGITYSVTEGLKKAHSLNGKQLRQATNRILARAVYIALTRDHSCEDIEQFYRDNYFPGLGACSRRTMRRAENLINKEFIHHAQEAFLNHYMQRTSANRADGGFMMVVDGTSIYQKNLNLDNVNWGRGKDGHIHSQISVQLVSDSSANGLPLFYMVFPGSTNDMSAFPALLEQLALLGFSYDKARWLGDRGFGSAENMVNCRQKGYGFLFKMKQGAGTVINDAMDEAIRGGILQSCNWLKPNDSTTCYVVRREYRYDGYPVAGKRKSYKEALPVNLHVFYNRRIYNNEYDKLTSRVQAAIQAVSNGLRVSDSDKELLSELTNFNPETYKQGQSAGDIKVIVKNFNEKLKYSGLMVLATDDLDASSLEVLNSYDRRGIVESHIQVTKDTLQGYVTNAKTSAGMDSKIHLLWMATVARVALTNSLNMVKQKGVQRYTDSLRSVDTVLAEAAGLKVDTLVSGIVVKPASKKTLTTIEAFGLSDIPCQVSYSKWAKNMLNDSEPDDELDSM